MAHGIVTSFDRAGGHGYVQSDDGESLWVHAGNVVDDSRTLVEGQRVEFVRRLGGMGAQAVDVTPVAVTP